MRIKSKEVRPIRKKDGTWTTVTREFEEDIPDLGREELICNICGFKDYPNCKESLCTAWKKQTLKQ